MAVYSGFGWDESFLANVDLSSYQWRFVKFASGSPRQINAATGGCNPMPFGVLQDKPKAGEMGSVRIMGTSKLKVYGGSLGVTYGMLLASGSTAWGEGVTASAVQCMALEAVAAGASAVIEALLLPFLTAYAVQ